MGYVIIGVLTAGIGVLAVVICIKVRDYVREKEKGTKDSR